MKSKLFSVIVVTIFIFSATTPLLNALENIKAPLKSIEGNKTVDNAIGLNSALNNNTTNQTVNGMTIYVDSKKGNDSWAGGDPAFPKKTVKKALKAVPEYGRIVLIPGSVFKESWISIDKSVDIYSYAQGAVIDGENDGRVMETGYEKRITITGVTIINGKVYHPIKSGAGLYIYDRSKVVIENCTFQNNCAESPAMGGAIYNDGEYLKIINSNFTSNTGYRGGAISNQPGIYTRDINKVEIENCTFTKNEAHDNWEAGGEGGAIYNYEGTINISDSTFRNNYAGSNGGVIYNDGGRVSILNTKLALNSARGEAGAVFNWYGNMDIYNGTFIGNRVYKYYGGAITCFCGDLNITNSNFSDNTAQKRGGAIHQMYNTLNIFNCIFHRNVAGNSNDPGDGGAILAHKVRMPIKNTSFTKNKAYNHGGAIYLEGTEKWFDNLIFKENTNGRGQIDDVYHPY